MPRLDQERQERLEPIRRNGTFKVLHEMGVTFTLTGPKQLNFIVGETHVQFFPYSGYWAGKGIGSGRGFNQLLIKIRKAMAKEHEGALLPREEGAALMANFMKNRKPLPTEKLLTAWRHEWLMSHKVFGNKVARTKKNTAARRKAVQEYCERMQMIEQIGHFLKERVGIQTSLLTDSENG